MTERIEGPAVEDAKPVQAQKLKYRIRAWMVKDEVLEAHPDWYEAKRVAKNGVLWGDDEDSVEEPAKRKRRAHGGGTMKRPRVDTSAIEAARARIAEVTNGIDPDLIFDGLVM